MSDNFMGGGLPAPEQPEETPATGRDPKVLIGGGIGLALVAVVGGYLLLGGGGSSDSPSAPTAARPAVTHAAPTTPSASAPAGKATAAIRTFNGDVGRDPFNPLITPPPVPTTTAAATPKPGTTAVPAPGATTPGPVVSGLPTGGVPVVLPTNVPVLPTTTPAPTTTKAPAVVVVLKAIAFHGSTPYVVVSFSGKSIALKTGDTSAGNLKVVAIAPDDGTATFQLGDQTFDLHIGQSYVD